MTTDIFEALGLDRNPFSMAADTEGYFHTDATKQILDELAFGILSRKGFLLLAGEVGVGKTSLLYQLLRRLEGENLVTSWIFNTMLNKEELLHAIAKDYGLDAPKSANVAQLIDLLQGFLVEQNAQDKNCAIIVDEAHNLSLPAMEALRMLSNLEVSGRKLVQILLVGQPELKERLDEKKLRQLRSRISIFRELEAFDLDATGRYVNFKLSSAQSQFRISGAPLKVLHRATEGNTRMINLIMERTLYAAVAFGERELTVKVIKAAVAEIASCQIEVAERMGRSRKRMKSFALVAGVLMLFAAAVLPYIPSDAGARSPLGFVVERVMVAMQPAQEQQEQQPAQKPEVAPVVRIAEQKPAPVVAAQSVIEKPQVMIADVAEKPQADASKALKSQKVSLTAEPKAATSSGNQQLVKAVKTFPGSYYDFLKPMGLESKVSDFSDAVDSGQIDRLEEVLPGGVQALKLDRLPAKRVVSFTAFPWKKTVNDNPAWLALWHPPFIVKDFYYGYRHEDILVLQRMLKKLGYYWGPDDGMVGPVTWRAINSFQKDMKLKRTMWPDPETVFWLNVMSKQG
ncbi:ExeA family protein [Desulfovibrio ferrophilus]|uniref:Peptidoglycan-binding domain 1 protein n=1 Tax=Desulfovibrio ferrophilus TaxID=241368 RepID=A0A2Z6AZN7_9BACT|nr:ExeA family protein [Desulfovibrio ferrophilus]BBD08712.1 peptidoglycan-binding domain 1 protein [Desulfovibrio ferrophilus]